MTPPKSKAWLVAIDGAGEIDSDFSVIVYRADTAQEALDKAIKGGYGKTVAYVAKLEDVLSYGLGERRGLTSDLKPWADLVSDASPAMRQFMDPDELAHTPAS